MTPDAPPAPTPLPYDRPMAVGELRVDGGDGGLVQIRLAQPAPFWVLRVTALALFSASTLVWLGNRTHACFASGGGGTRWAGLFAPGLWSLFFAYHLVVAARSRVRLLVMDADRERVGFGDGLNRSSLPTSRIRAFRVEPRPNGHALVLLPHPGPAINMGRNQWSCPEKLGPFDVLVHSDHDRLRRAARELNALLPSDPTAATA